MERAVEAWRRQVGCREEEGREGQEERVAKVRRVLRGTE